MKSIKRLTMALIFCVTLILYLTPCASAESGTWSNLNWTLDDTGKLTISGSGNMDNFYNWSTTAWLSQKSAIKTVVIESGVTSIGNYAFSNCNNLTNVIIGKNISWIGRSVFTNCNNLTNISVDPVNPTYHDRDGVLFNSNMNEIVCFPAARSGSYYIPNGVTSIGSNAFDGCRKLTSVTIPDSVTNIGYWAFNCCYGLTSITIPDSVTTLDEGVFCNCGGLSTVTLGANVNSIGEGIFGSCGRLINIYVNPTNAFYHDRDGVLFRTSNIEITCYPPGRSGTYSIASDVTSIGPYAFEGSDLTSVTVPNSVTNIGKRAFYCSELTSIIIPDSVTSIGYGAFDGCLKLTSVTISNGVTSIPEWAFSECRNLTSVAIPTGVTSIGRYAFQCCEKLANVSIPNSVNNIGTGAFYQSDNIRDVYYSGTQTQWNNISLGIENESLSNATIHYNYSDIIDSGTCGAQGNNLNWTLFSNGDLVINGSGNMADFNGIITYYTDEITQQPAVSLETNAPWDNIKNTITKVIFEPRVTSIGDCAFAGCINLKGVIISENVTSVGHSAFWYCSQLSSITLPEGVKSIGYNAFDHCSSLLSISIPESVISIGSSVFHYCDNLLEILVADSNSFYSDIDGVLFNKNATKLLSYPGGRKGAYDIPTSVIIIGKSSFQGCNGLTSVTIPAGVICIENSAFYGTKGLKSVALPDGLKDIENYAFAWCENLTRITIHEGITSIARSTFSGCKSLSSVTIPKGVTIIGDSAFNDCGSLTSVTIPEGVTSIDNAAFFRCSSLTKVTIPNSLNSIGNQAFDYCSVLTDVYYNGTQDQWNSISVGNGNEPLNNTTIHFITWPSEPDFILPAALVEICDEAFMRGMFTYAKLPESCMKIGSRAFADCPNLRCIYIPVTTTSIDRYSFENTKNITIIGKDGSYAEFYAQKYGFTFESVS